MVTCLQRGADCLHMVQLMPLHPQTPSSLASFKSRPVLPFWYWLAQVVLEKRPLGKSKVKYTDIAVRTLPATPLRELTCRTGSHGVTCHPTEVTF